MSRPEPPPTADLMAERYGRRNRGTRLLVLVLVAILVLASLGWVGWAAWVHGNPEIQADVAAFDVPSAHEARARVELRLGDDDVTGTCLLRATAADHSIVGERNVQVDELQESSWVSIRTERRATSVTLEHCTTG